MSWKVTVSVTVTETFIRKCVLTIIGYRNKIVRTTITKSIVNDNKDKLLNVNLI